MPWSVVSCCGNVGGDYVLEGERGSGGTMKQDACRTFPPLCTCHFSLM